MKIIFTKNSPSGKMGQIKEVSDGYAQNFLLPSGVALSATESNIAKVKNAQKKAEQSKVGDLKKIREIADDLRGLVIKVSGKANEKGKLFAAIGEKEIATALEKKEVELKHFKMDKHLKEIGEHKVILKLDHGVEVFIKVFVEGA